MKQTTKRTRKYVARSHLQQGICAILIVVYMIGLIDDNEFPPKFSKNTSQVMAKEPNKAEQKKQETANTPNIQSIAGSIQTVMSTTSSEVLERQKIDLSDVRPTIRNDFKWNRILKQRDELKNRKIVCDSNDVTRISNLTIYEMKELFAGTWLEGREQELYEYEHQYNVNVFFIYGVSSLESGYGDSPLAKSTQNYYGINLDASWDNWDECSDYWCDMISRLYCQKGIKSIEEIAPIYCPPRFIEWTNDVTWLMNAMYNKYQNQVGQLQEVA